MTDIFLKLMLIILIFVGLIITIIYIHNLSNKNRPNSLEIYNQHVPKPEYKTIEVKPQVEQTNGSKSYMEWLNETMLKVNKIVQGMKRKKNMSCQDIQTLDSERGSVDAEKVSDKPEDMHVGNRREEQVSLYDSFNGRLNSKFQDLNEFELMEKWSKIKNAMIGLNDIIH